MIALIDCNNFYASCERVFNPKLNDQAIIVLSNNDGCVIARSNQAKVLGITMGIPYFKIAKLCQQKSIAVFSSNYTLYGDMSLRIMSILQSLEQHVEIYSIDEAFIHYDYRRDNLAYNAQKIRQYLLKTTSIPTSIGIAPTKTLAKVANYFAKKHSITGIVEFKTAAEWEKALAQLPLNEVWGIGSRWINRLLNLGITTPLELARAPAKQMRQQFSVVVERIVHELNGISCIAREIPTPRQQIIVSRAFGNHITALTDLITATTHYVVRAFEKLRQQDSFVQQLQVFVAYRSVQSNYPLQQNSMIYTFAEPTQDTRMALQAVKTCLEKLYCGKHIYKKSGVILSQLTDRTQQMNAIFTSPIVNLKSKKVMSTVDLINNKFGNNTLMLAPQLGNNLWKTQANRRSPRYTSQWSELVLVK